MTEVKLWAHQQKAIDLADKQPHLALFLEIGTGKTATMINILRRDYNKHKKVCSTLIFAPLSVCPQWKEEFAKWSKIPQEDILVLTGPGASRVKALQSRTKPAIVVTNYESVRIKAFYDALLKFSPEIVILDESQRVKDPQSVQSGKIYPICHSARRRFIMTGTPFLNSQLDIFGQFKALDPNIFGHNFWKFKHLYFYDKNAGRPNCNFPDWQPKPDTSARISQLIANSSVQAKKSECLDLPPLLEVQVPVELSPAQRKAYEDMRKHFVAEVGEQLITAEFAMTKTLRMQQILAGYLAQDSESDPHWMDNPRLQALEDILEQINKEKVIIWTNWRPTYQKIAKVCEDQGYKIAFLTGDQTAVQKQISIQSFQNGDINALICNPSAGGAGINLQAAKYSVYYSRGYSLEHFLQSQGRNYRGGSEIHDRITHYHLIAKGTLDEVIAKALLSKQEVGEQILRWAKEGLDTGKRNI